jgi:hypothetical protein
LLESYASFKTAKSVPRSQLREAVGHIIRLYEAWGKEEEAAKWRAELKALDAFGEKAGTLSRQDSVPGTHTRSW